MMKIGIFLNVVFIGVLVQAKCLVPADRIEEIAQKISWQSESGEALNTALVQSTVEGSLSNDGTKSEMVYEAFVRPDEDGVFQLLPLPLFVVEMKASRDSVYVCAHFDSEDESRTEALIYFLRNGRIKSVLPKPLPLMSLKNFFWDNLKRTPLVLVALPLQITEVLQATTINFISDFTKIGIDRVRIRNRQVELYSGGNPAQFESYVIRRIIPFDEAKSKALTEEGARAQNPSSSTYDPPQNP